MAGLALLWGLLGCGGGPGPSLERLWYDPWQRVSLAPGEWVSGVRLASGLEWHSPGAGRLRFRIVEPGSRAEALTISGPAGTETIELVAGKAEVDLEVRAGLYRISGPPDLFLIEPRFLPRGLAADVTVVVLVDTLRADHATASELPRTFRALPEARDFRDVSANASWTLPSIASLFTSQPVLDLTAPDGTLIGIPPGRATLAERIHALGVSTAAFVANETIREENGFGRGFDHFWSVGELGARQPPDVAEVVQRARDWLRRHRGEPAFLYIHLMDPHEPWRDHAGRGRKVPPSRILASRQRPATEQETRWMHELYTEEVQHVDRTLGPFLEELPAESRIVLTSDHGEMLGEHGVWGHGLTLFEPVLRVPLLLQAPGVEPGPDGASRQLLDLAPTLLELLGDPRGGDGMAGVSLLGASDQPVVAATFSAGPLRWAWRSGSRKLLFHSAIAPAQGADVVFGEVHPLPSGLFAFDLEGDPGEERSREVSEPSLIAFAEAFAASVEGFAPGWHRLHVGPSASETPRLPTGGLRQSWADAEGARKRRFLYLVFEPDRAPGGGSDSRAAVERHRPAIDGLGRYEWVDRAEPVAFSEQNEILDRLRNLGYLD